VGWLAVGPGDRYFPWYGRGISRVNVVNINNIHNNYGGVGPLREGPHAFSNVDRALSDEHVRNGISSMQSNQFGHERVPAQQSRIDAGSFRQASMMTGASPVSPSHESFQSTNRQASPGSIPNRSVSSQHFFGGTARQNTSMQAGRGPSSFNGGANAAGNTNRGPVGEQGQRGQSIQSSRPGWRTFTPPAGSQIQSNGRGLEGQGRPQSQPQARPYNSQSTTPGSAPQRQYQNQSNSRQSSYSTGASRPTLNMQQPVVAPRGGGSYQSRPMPSAPSYGGYRGAPSGSVYRGGAPAGGSRGGNPGGGSHGAPHAASHGGSSGGHGGHH
jgi:hypothetical protein